MTRTLTFSLVLLAVGIGGNALSLLPGIPLNPNGNVNKCLDVRGAVFANGTPVQIYDCNNTGAQKWEFVKNQAPTEIRLAGTNFCLDAGSNPWQPNGNQLKIWECYNTLPQQRWFVGNDNKIKLSDVQYGQSGVCLDLTDGRLDNTNVVQTWECSPNNPNQVWTNALTPTQPPTTTIAPPSTTDDYPKPGCPVYSCAACPAGYSHAFIAPQPTLCHACACVLPAPNPAAPIDPPGGDYPRPGCPVYSCPACPPGSSHGFHAPNPTACHGCACIGPAAHPITTPPPAPTPVDDYPRPGCPVFTCAACPTGLIQTITAANPTACHSCACVFPTQTVSGSVVDGAAPIPAITVA